MNRPKSTELETLLASLYSRINYERQTKVTARHFKLQSMREFLRRLGDPHLKYPVVHVAGTKGKGSVATMVGQILRASGRRTGVYVSPHLECINQRMMINGMPIGDQDLVETLQAIEPIANELDDESQRMGRRTLTFFEVITVAAFHYFEKQHVDAVVLEVGLGGRMDSTNVCLPLVSVITNISFDHTRQLGTTLEKIAAEKAGIIKPGVQVISGVVAPGAAEVIAQVAAQADAPLAVLDRDFRVVQATETVSCDESPCSAPIEISGCIGNRNFEIDNITLGMLGSHQQANAAISVAAIESLNRCGWNISDSHIRTGLAEARLAGRTEIRSRKPLVILDIAHNVASVNALIATLSAMPEWSFSCRKTLIIATSQEKDAEGMLRPLMEVFDRIVITKYQNNPRGTPAEELLELAIKIRTQTSDRDTRGSSELDPSLKFPELMIQANPVEAWEAVAGNLQDDDFVCIAGSVFLVAELRPLTGASVS